MTTSSDSLLRMLSINGCCILTDAVIRTMTLKDHATDAQVRAVLTDLFPDVVQGAPPRQGPSSGKTLTLDLLLPLEVWHVATPRLHDLFHQRTLVQWNFAWEGNTESYQCTGLLAGFVPGATIEGPDITLEIFIP